MKQNYKFTDTQDLFIRVIILRYVYILLLLVGIG